MGEEAGARQKKGEKACPAGEDPKAPASGHYRGKPVFFSVNGIHYWEGCDFCPAGLH
ncbi:MAG: hypothetical protein IKD81_09165 [Eubacteriaceae bacterium]|nr:hypothetical protein [Eubacteriaceae bacterium]